MIGFVDGFVLDIRHSTWKENLRTFGKAGIYVGGGCFLAAGAVALSGGSIVVGSGLTITAKVLADTGGACSAIGTAFYLVGEE